MLGRLFKGFIRPTLGCDVCGMVYERDTSTWTGIAFFLYFALCFLVAVEGLILALTFGLFDGFAAVMIAVALLQVGFAPAVERVVPQSRPRHMLATSLYARSGGQGTLEALRLPFAWQATTDVLPLYEGSTGWLNSFQMPPL